MGIIHPGIRRGVSANCSLLLLLFLPFLLFLHLPSSAANRIRVPGEIPFAVKLGRGSPRIFRNWIKNGEKTRIKINVQYSSEFQLPPEAECQNRGNSGLFTTEIFFCPL